MFDKECEMVTDRKCMDSLENNFNTVSDNLDTYIQNSGSVMVADWTIKTLKVGKVLTVANVPSDTTVIVKVKEDASTDAVIHTTLNFRKVIDVDLDDVDTMLDTVSANSLKMGTCSCWKLEMLISPRLVCWIIWKQPTCLK